MKTFKRQAAQGDLLITKIDKLPEGVTPLKTKTVALGEATGHHHTFRGNVKIYDGGVQTGNMGQPIIVKYAHVLADAILEHGETPGIESEDRDLHESLSINEPGIYEIRQQVERSVYGWRQVLD